MTKAEATSACEWLDLCAAKGGGIALEIAARGVSCRGGIAGTLQRNDAKVGGVFAARVGRVLRQERGEERRRDAIAAVVEGGEGGTKVGGRGVGVRDFAR